MSRTSPAARASSSSLPPADAPLAPGYCLSALRVLCVLCSSYYFCTHNATWATTPLGTAVAASRACTVGAASAAIAESSAAAASGVSHAAVCAAGGASATPAAVAVPATASLLRSPAVVRCTIPELTGVAAAAAAAVQPWSMLRDEAAYFSVRAASAAFFRNASGVCFLLLSAVLFVAFHLHLPLRYAFSGTGQRLHLLMRAAAAGSCAKKTFNLAKHFRAVAPIAPLLLLLVFCVAPAAGTPTSGSTHHCCCCSSLRFAVAVAPLLRTASISASFPPPSTSVRSSCPSLACTVAPSPQSAATSSDFFLPPASRRLLPAATGTTATPAAAAAAAHSASVSVSRACVSRAAASLARTPATGEPTHTPLFCALARSPAAAPPATSASSTAASPPAAAAALPAAVAKPCAAETTSHCGVAAVRGSTATAGPPLAAATHASAVAAAAAGAPRSADTPATACLSATVGGPQSAALEPRVSAATQPSPSPTLTPSSPGSTALSFALRHCTSAAAGPNAIAADSSSSSSSSSSFSYSFLFSSSSLSFSSSSSSFSSSSLSSCFSSSSSVALRHASHCTAACRLVRERAAFPSGSSGAPQPEVPRLRIPVASSSTPTAQRQSGPGVVAAAATVAVAAEARHPHRRLATAALRRPYPHFAERVSRVPCRRERLLVAQVARSTAEVNNAAQQWLHDSLRCCCARSLSSSISAGRNAARSRRPVPVERGTSEGAAAAAPLSGGAAVLPGGPLSAAAGCSGPHEARLAAARCADSLTSLRRSLFHSQWGRSAAAGTGCRRLGSGSPPCSSGSTRAAMTSCYSTSARSAYVQTHAPAYYGERNTSRAGGLEDKNRCGHAWLVRHSSSGFNISSGARGRGARVCRDRRGGGERTPCTFTSISNRSQHRPDPCSATCDSRSCGSSIFLCISRDPCSRRCGGRSDRCTICSSGVLVSGRRGHSTSRVLYGNRRLCSRSFQATSSSLSAFPWGALARSSCTAWVAARACDVLLPLRHSTHQKLSRSESFVLGDGATAGSRACTPAAAQAASAHVAAGRLVGAAAAAASPPAASTRDAAATTGLEGPRKHARKRDCSVGATSLSSTCSCHVFLAAAAGLRSRNICAEHPTAEQAGGIALSGVCQRQREDYQQMQRRLRGQHVNGHFHGPLILQRQGRDERLGMHLRSKALHWLAPLWSARQQLLLDGEDVEHRGWEEETDDWDESEALQEAEEREASLDVSEGGEEESEWGAEAENKEERHGDVYEELRALERVRDKELLMSWGAWSKAVGRSVDELKSLVRTAYGICGPTPAASPAAAAMCAASVTSGAAMRAPALPAGVSPAPAAAAVRGAAAPRGRARVAADSAGHAKATIAEVGKTAEAQRCRRGKASGEAAFSRKGAETHGAERAAAAGRAIRCTGGAASHTGAREEGAADTPHAKGEQLGRPLKEESTRRGTEEENGPLTASDSHERATSANAERCDIIAGSCESLQTATAGRRTHRYAQAKQRESKPLMGLGDVDGAVGGMEDLCDRCVHTPGSEGRLRAAGMQLLQDKEGQREKQKHRSRRQEYLPLHEHKEQQGSQQNRLRQHAEQQEGKRDQATYAPLQSFSMESTDREKQVYMKSRSGKEGYERITHSYTGIERPSFYADDADKGAGDHQWSVTSCGAEQRDSPHLRRDGHVSSARDRETATRDEAEHSSLYSASPRASPAGGSAVEFRLDSVAVTGSAATAERQQAALGGVATHGEVLANAAAVDSAAVAVDTAARSDRIAAGICVSASSDIVGSSGAKEAHLKRKTQAQTLVKSNRKQKEKADRGSRKAKGGREASSGVSRGRSSLASLLLSTDEYRQLLSLSRVEAVRAALEGAANEEDVSRIPQEREEEYDSLGTSESEFEEFPEEKHSTSGRQRLVFATTSAEAAEARGTIAHCHTGGGAAAAARLAHLGGREGCLLRPPTVEEWARAVTAGDVNELSRRLTRGRTLLEKCLQRLQPLAQAAVQRFRAANKLAALVRQQLREQGDYEAVKAYMAKGTEEELELLLVAMQGIRQGLRRHARTALRRRVRLKRERREQMLRQQLQILQQQRMERQRRQQLQQGTQQQQGQPQQQELQRQQRFQQQQQHTRRQQEAHAGDARAVEEGAAGDIVAECSGVGRRQEVTVGPEKAPEDDQHVDGNATAAADGVAADTAAADAALTEDEEEEADAELEPPPSVAYWLWMRTAMADWEQQKRQVSQFPWRWWREAARGRKAAHILYQELGREPTQEEVADRIGVAPDRWRDITMATKAAVSTEAEISGGGGVPGMSLGGGAADTGDRRDTVGDFLVSEDFGQEGEQASLREDLEVQVLDLAAQALNPGEYRMLKKLLAASHGGEHASSIREKAVATAEGGASETKERQSFSRSEGDNTTDRDETGQPVQAEAHAQCETSGLHSSKKRSGANQQQKRRRRQTLRGQGGAVKGLAEASTEVQRKAQQEKEGEHRKQMRETKEEENKDTEEAGRLQQREQEDMAEQRRGRRTRRHETQKDEVTDQQGEDACNIRRVLVDFMNDRVNTKLQGVIEKMKEFEVRRILANLSPQERADGLQNPQALEAVVHRKSAVLQLCLSANTQQGVDQ